MTVMNIQDVKKALINDWIKEASQVLNRYSLRKNSMTWANTDKEIEQADAEALEYAEELEARETTNFGMGV